MKAIIRMFLLWWCCLPVGLAAQTPVQDIVYLKNGAIIKGSIKEYQPGVNLVIDIGNGRLVTFIGEEILRVEQQATQQEESPDDANTIDLVFLYNGSVFKGKILYENDKELVLRLSNGENILFYAREIQELRRNQPLDAVAGKKKYDYQYVPWSGKVLKNKEYAFRERGWFNTTSFVMPGGSYDRRPLIGIGLHNLTGYQFSRLLGVGIGAGFDAFTPSGGEYIASLYGEGRSYLLKKRTTPFISLGAGYGFAFRNFNNFITGAKGGLRVYPAAGLRMGADKDLNILLDVGYIFQEATYTREMPFFNPGIEIREVSYRRLTLRLGAMF